MHDVVVGSGGEMEPVPAPCVHKGTVDVLEVQAHHIGVLNCLEFLGVRGHAWQHWAQGRSAVRTPKRGRLLTIFVKCSRSLGRHTQAVASNIQHTMRGGVVTPKTSRGET